MALSILVAFAIVGVVTSRVGQPSVSIRAGISPPASPSGDDGAISRLETNLHALENGPPKEGASGRSLPDAETMIDRLTLRLLTTPNDVEGWRMLGWSHFHLGRYDLATSACERAVGLAPGSDELKRLYEEARTKASTNAGPALTSPNGRRDTP